jgi:hypothetical protein
LRFLLLAVAFLLALSGCHLKTDPPGEAPTGVKAEPGDGLVLLTWDTLPDLTYWIFFQPGGDVAAAAPGAIAIRRAVSPRAIGNLQNGTQYAFVMNATRNDSAAGPSSPVLLATPRLAGDSNTWVSGTPLGTPPQNLNSIAFSGSRFVVVGDAVAGTPTIFAGDYNYTSADPNPPGVSAWIPPTAVPSVAANLSSVIFNGPLFVALGTDGSVVSSADGLTWVSNSPVPAGVSMNGIAFGQVFGVTPTFVAVGNGGKIFTSADLATWTARDVSALTTNDLNGVSLVNGIFFATGAGGTLLSSADGITWNLLNSGATSALRAVSFNAPLARYIAVGDAGTMVTSVDGGVTWTGITPVVAQDLMSVTVGGASGSRFLAVGQGGAVVFSDDGVNWTVASAGSANLAKVVSAPSLYLAVGEAGTNVVSK